MNDLDYDMILGLQADEDLTIKDYLKELLLTLWREGESFSGKYGISGCDDWEVDLYKPLIKHGIVKGDYDEEYGDIKNYNYKECDRLIGELIEYIFSK